MLVVGCFWLQDGSTSFRHVGVVSCVVRGHAIVRRLVSMSFDVQAARPIFSNIS